MSARANPNSGSAAKGQAVRFLDVCDPARVLAALPTPVLVVSQQNQILYVNAAIETLFGLSQASLLGHPLARFIAEDHPLFLLIERARQRRNRITDHGLSLSSPLIGTHQVSVNLTSLDEEGEPVVIAVTPLDQSQKFSEHWAQRSVARTMDGLAGMLGHEIKNPLAGIRGAAQLLAPALEKSEDRELATLIVEETERVAALVDSMEAFSQPLRFRPERVNIHRVLKRVVTSARAGFAAHVNFEESFDPSLPPVAGDQNMLIQILMNLVKNAAEALEGQTNPQITLSTRYRHGMQITLPGSQAPLKLPLQVSVRDNGPGIREEVKANLFSPFISSKSGGRGLGLALVAKMTQDMNGVIELDSEPGQTEFRLLLPEYQHHDDVSHLFNDPDGAREHDEVAKSVQTNAKSNAL